MPAGDKINLSLPSSSGFSYQLFTGTGQIVDEGTIEPDQQTHTLNLEKLKQGVYLIRLNDQSGVIFRIKILKKD